MSDERFQDEPGKAKDKPEKGKKDKRIAPLKNCYKCPTCGFWHLTCQELHKKEGGRRER